MKKIAIGLAAASLLLAGCGSNEDAPEPAATAQPQTTTDPSVAEWHRIANKYEPKIDGTCMTSGDSIRVNACLKMTGAGMDTLEKSVERQPHSPYRTELLDHIDNYQLARERYDSTDAWCDGSNVLEKPSCTVLGNMMDKYAGEVDAQLQLMIDSR